MEGDNEIMVMKPQVAHGSVGQIELESLPVVTVIEGDPNAFLGAGEQKALADGVFAHGVNGSVVWEASGDESPSLSTIARAINVRAQIIDAKAAHRSVGGLVIKVRGDDLRHLAPRGQFGRRHIFPLGAAV